MVISSQEKLKPHRYHRYSGFFLHLQLTPTQPSSLKLHINIKLPGYRACWNYLVASPLTYDSLIIASTHYYNCSLLNAWVAVTGTLESLPYK